MPDAKITALTTINGADVATGDELVIVDISDTSMAASGTTKAITALELTNFLDRFGLPQPATGVEQETNTSNTTWVDVTGVSWSVTSGRTYWVRIGGIYQTAATTTGIQFRLNGPTTSFAVNRVSVRQAANGTDSFFDAGSADLTQNAASASVVAANTDYVFWIDAVFVASSTATLQLQFRSEINASQALVQSGVRGIMQDVTGT